ncbi:MAG: bifunctional chorismate mutase/prephenate dehydratase [Clostridia bacterium]|nr:bifunctional chorismate mutase/prephenate dehydratase [Clostridia bacterium]
MLRITYPGTQGSFSQQAAKAFFGEEAAYLGQDSWEEAALMVQMGEADYGVFPVENSSAGSVPLSFDLMTRYGLYIQDEKLVKIRHHLLGVKGANLAEICQVHSHPQAIAQCDDYLAAHPNWRLTPSSNTAVSARQVAQGGDRSQAAIASLEAAEAFGLQVLAEDIQSSQLNATRFACVGRDLKSLRAPTKASIYFILDNQVGALNKLLTSFANYQLNMSRIVSYPLKDRPFEYYFLADFEGQMDAEHLYKALADSRKAARELRLLGIYGKEE